VSRGQRNGSPRPLISVFWTGVATFYSSNSSIETGTNNHSNLLKETLSPEVTKFYANSSFSL